MATNNAWNTNDITTDGQLLIGNTGSRPSVATLTQGSNVTITNGSGTITIAASNGGTGPGSNTGFYMFDDFLTTAPEGNDLYGTEAWMCSLGTGTSAPGTDNSIDSDHPGVLSFAASSGAGVKIIASKVLDLGGGTWTVECLMQTPSSLSDGTDTYLLAFGFRDPERTNTAATDSCYLRYRHDINSGKWELVTEKNSAGSSTLDTGVTVATSTWYKLRIDVNAAATSVEVFIDDVSKGTTSTNIPDGRDIQVIYAHDWDAGATRTSYVDYMMIDHTLTNSR